jgi:hypothetical protein
MQPLFQLFYALLFFAYALFTLFIVFHLLNYSLNKRVATLTVAFFLLGTVVLVAANALLFFNIPFDAFTVPGFTIPNM